jgi:hypothetical protein
MLPASFALATCAFFLLAWDVGAVNFDEENRTSLLSPIVFPLLVLFFENYCLPNNLLVLPQKK